MQSSDEAGREEKGALLTRDGSLAAIARDLTAVVDTLEADWTTSRIVRPETASRLREIISRAQQIADCVE